MNSMNAMGGAIPFRRPPASPDPSRPNFDKVSFGVAEIPVKDSGLHCVLEARMEDSGGRRVVITSDMPIPPEPSLDDSVGRLKRLTVETLTKMMETIPDKIEFAATRVYPEGGGYRCELRTKCAAPDGGCSIRVVVDMPLDPAVPLKEAVEELRSRAGRNMAEAVEALARSSRR